jgi:Flp pilus assembly protein TadG
VIARARRRDESGAIAVLVAFSAVALFVIAALVVDLGLARDTRRQAQNAADASSLAAANALYPDAGTCTTLNADGGVTPPCYADAIAAAKEYAAVNWGTVEADWSACADAQAYWRPTGSTACISFADVDLDAVKPTTPTEVRVIAPARIVHTGLGVAAGVSQVQVAAGARAGLAPNTTYDCALCFLGEVDAGNADVTVSGGGIQVNGSLSIGATAYWTAETIGASGTAAGGHFTPAVTASPGFTDPLASLVLPTPSGTKFPGVHSCTTSLDPGIYSSLTLGNKDTCTLNPGLYVITGQWLLGNKSLLQGTGVTLYFTCGTPASVHTCTASDLLSGWLDGKNGDVALGSGAAGFADFVIIYDRANPRDVKLQGNGGTSLNGALYAPNANLDFNGNSCFGFSKGPVVVDGLIKANGTKSCITIADAVDRTAATQPGQIALDQ